MTPFVKSLCVWTPYAILKLSQDSTIPTKMNATTPIKMPCPNRASSMYRPPQKNARRGGLLRGPSDFYGSQERIDGSRQHIAKQDDDCNPSPYCQHFLVHFSSKNRRNQHADRASGLSV